MQGPHVPGLQVPQCMTRWFALSVMKLMCVGPSRPSGCFSTTSSSDLLCVGGGEGGRTHAHSSDSSRANKAGRQDACHSSQAAQRSRRVRQNPKPCTHGWCCASAWTNCWL